MPLCEGGGDEDAKFRFAHEKHKREEGAEDRNRVRRKVVIIMGKALLYV